MMRSEIRTRLNLSHPAKCGGGDPRRSTPGGRCGGGRFVSGEFLRCVSIPLGLIDDSE
jgi:hypothetical protein